MRAHHNSFTLLYRVSSLSIALMEENNLYSETIFLMFICNNYCFSVVFLLINHSVIHSHILYMPIDRLCVIV